MIMVGDIEITPGFQQRVDAFLGPFGIDTEFKIPKFELDPTAEDPYITFQRIGAPLVIGRSLSA